MICPNLNDPEVAKKFRLLESIVPESAYYLWNKYQGEVPAKYYNLAASTPIIKEGVPELFESNFLIFAESETSDEVMSKLLANKTIDKKCS